MDDLWQTGSLSLDPELRPRVWRSAYTVSVSAPCGLPPLPQSCAGTARSPAVGGNVSRGAGSAAAVHGSCTHVRERLQVPVLSRARWVGDPTFWTPTTTCR
jgi:hypothetical protein